MREIKFRGFVDTDGIGWLYGSVLFKNGNPYIFSGYEGEDFDNCEHGWNWLAIIPESLGQFTGLHDKNGVEIYEGDIVKTDELGCVCKCIYRYDGFILFDKKGGFYFPTWVECEVIGNINENPELLA